MPRVTNLQNLAAGIPAEDDRLLAATPFPAVSGLHSRTGILPGPAGYVGEVTLLSATSIQCNPFRAMIAGTQSTVQGDYRVVNDAVLTRAIAPSDPTLGRIDLLVTYVRDTAYVPNEGVDDVQYAVVVPGTPAAVPAAPATPANALLHGTITIPAGAGAVTFTPAAVAKIVALGGIRPALNSDATAGAFPGQWRDAAIDTGATGLGHLERWNGTQGAWEPMPPGRTRYYSGGLTGPTYTINPADEGRMLSNNAAGAATVVTAPMDDSAFPVGGFVDIVRHAAGTVTIASPGLGSQLGAGGQYTANATYSVRRYGVVRLVKLSNGAWYLYDLSGDAPGSRLNSPGFSAASGWSLGTNYITYCGNGMALFYCEFVKTGTALTVTTTGDVTNTLCGTMPAGWYPWDTSTVGSGAGGRMATFYVNSGNGNINLPACAPGSNIAVGELISASGLYPLQDPSVYRYA